MSTWRTATLTTMAALVAAPLATLAVASVATTGSIPAAGAETSTTAVSEQARAGGVVTFTDASGDVRNRKLDIRTVTVRNTADALVVRVNLPGVRKTYDYPTGYISVHLDTDRAHRGPEYGHFMQFWSDYRFAETDGWRERTTDDWSHSPDGRCVADAGLRGDKAAKLRWFEYRVLKKDGCFEADAVRVAVTAVNDGENHPYVPHDRAFVDHLGARHAWTPWVPVTP